MFLNTVQNRALIVTKTKLYDCSFSNMTTLSYTPEKNICCSEIIMNQINVTRLKAGSVIDFGITERLYLSMVLCTGSDTTVIIEHLNYNLTIRHAVTICPSITNMNFL